MLRELDMSLPRPLSLELPFTLLALLLLAALPQVIALDQVQARAQVQAPGQVLAQAQAARATALVLLLTLLLALALEVAPWSLLLTQVLHLQQVPANQFIQARLYLNRLSVPEHSYPCLAFWLFGTFSFKRKTYSLYFLHEMS